MSQEDGKLVNRIRQGDQRAFVQLVKKYQLDIYSLCFRMSGNQRDAEDLTQETFLRFYNSLERVQEGLPLRPWLLKIAGNATLDVLRRRRGTMLPLEELAESGEIAIADSAPLPEEASLAGEAREVVQAALLRIPVDFRIVLALRYLQGLSYREIGEVLDVPVSTVETRLFRAKKALATLLTGYVNGKEVPADDMPFGRQRSI